MTYIIITTASLKAAVMEYKYAIPFRLCWRADITLISNSSSQVIIFKFSITTSHRRYFIMADRKRVSYTYLTIEHWEMQDEKVREIIREDTGEDSWTNAPVAPPTSLPPPITAQAIDKLKDLDGVIVKEIIYGF
ncbi:hypothetical protein ACJZ2D_004139 [Fusarium nematophilum]